MLKLDNNWNVITKLMGLVTHSPLCYFRLQSCALSILMFLPLGKTTLYCLNIVNGIDVFFAHLRPVNLFLL